MPATRNCILILTSLSVFIVSSKRFTHSLLRIENELSRLNRNKERRFAREKQKGVVRTSAGESPAEGGSGGGKSAGTQRKCANCHQVGHIKTNKKYVLLSYILPLYFSMIYLLTAPAAYRLCPLLNGTMKPEDRVSESAFAMGAPPAV